MAVVPDTRHSVVIYKEFDYRGVTKRWGNRYHFEGALPTDNAAWIAFCDHITDGEQHIYQDTTTIVEAVGYDSSSASSTNPHGDAVFTHTYAKAGTGSFTPNAGRAPGDCAIFLRYSTPARSAKNHPIYLSNYFHGVIAPITGGDSLQPAQKGAVEDYADQWLAGFTADGSPRERCGPHGAVATARLVNGFIRHRDFPV